MSNRCLVWTSPKADCRQHSICVSCIYLHLLCSKLTVSCNVVICVLLNCVLCVVYSWSMWLRLSMVSLRFPLSLSAYRPPWSLRQGGCGRLRAMPLYRHCEEHTRPQVESTLRPVSPRAFLWCFSHGLFLHLFSERGKKIRFLLGLFEYLPPTSRLNLITNSSLRQSLGCYNASEFLCLSLFNLDKWTHWDVSGCAINRTWTVTDVNSRCIWPLTYLDTL